MTPGVTDAYIYDTSRKCMEDEVVSHSTEFVESIGLPRDPVHLGQELGL